MKLIDNMLTTLMPGDMLIYVDSIADTMKSSHQGLYLGFGYVLMQCDDTLYIRRLSPKDLSTGIDGGAQPVRVLTLKCILSRDVRSDSASINTVPNVDNSLSRLLRSSPLKSRLLRTPEHNNLYGLLSGLLNDKEICEVSGERVRAYSLLGNWVSFNAPYPHVYVSATENTPEDILRQLFLDDAVVVKKHAAENWEYENFLETQLCIGDIVAYRRNSKKFFLGMFYRAQRVMDRTKINHVGIYVGNGRMLETDSTGVGVRYIDKDVFSKSVSSIHRLTEFGIVPNGRTSTRYVYGPRDILASADRYLDKHDGEKYGYKALFAISLATLVGFFDRKRNYVFHDTKKRSDVCSELVYNVYADIDPFNHFLYEESSKLTGHKNPSPGDIVRSELLSTIKEWNKEFGYINK